MNCSVTRSIGNTSYKGIDDLMEYIIESKEIKERGRLDISDLFDNRGHLQIDGDIAQLLNFNTQAGIYPFDLRFYEWGGGAVCNMYYRINDEADWSSDLSRRFAYKPSEN